MVICLRCRRSVTKRDGFDPYGRPRYSCRPCRRAFTLHSSSAFSGSRWPADVILTAVRWYCGYPPAASHIMQLLAERHIDVSARPILTWMPTFGPRLAVAARPYRRRLGRRRWVDEVFCFRGQQKRYLYRAIDQCGQVIDVLLRDKRDRASAEAFFRRALSRTAVVPNQGVSDHHQPAINQGGGKYGSHGMPHPHEITLSEGRDRLYSIL